MSNYGELKTLFAGLLKRGDITTTQRDSWLQAGLARAQTLLRVPAMEKYVEFQPEDIEDGALPIPGDFLKLKSIYPIGGDKLKLRDITDVHKLRKSTGTPSIFARRGGQWLLGAYPTADAEFGVEYYSELPGLVADEDTNWLSTIRPYVIINGALTYAGKHFLDRRTEGWESDFQRDVAELNDQATSDELSEGQMSNGIEYEDDNG